MPATSVLPLLYPSIHFIPIEKVMVEMTNLTSGPVYIFRSTSNGSELI